PKRPGGGATGESRVRSLPRSDRFRERGRHRDPLTTPKERRMISLRRYRIAAFAGVTMPLAALALSACVSQQTYEQQGQQLQQAQAQVAAQQAEIARLQQEIKWVVAGDMLFPDGGYRLGSTRRVSARPTV